MWHRHKKMHICSHVRVIKLKNIFLSIGKPFKRKRGGCGWAGNGYWLAAPSAAKLSTVPSAWILDGIKSGTGWKRSAKAMKVVFIAKQRQIQISISAIMKKAKKMSFGESTATMVFFKVPIWKEDKKRGFVQILNSAKRDGQNGLIIIGSKHNKTQRKHWGKKKHTLAKVWPSHSATLVRSRPRN